LVDHALKSRQVDQPPGESRLGESLFFPTRYTRLRWRFCLLGAILLAIPQTLLFFADKLPPSNLPPLAAFLAGPLTGLILGWIAWRIWAEISYDGGSADGRRKPRPLIWRLFVALVPRLVLYGIPSLALGIGAGQLQNGGTAGLSIVGIAAYPVPTSIDQAMAAAYLEIRLVDEQRQYCSRQVPEQKSAIERNAYRFLDNSVPEVRAVNSFFGDGANAAIKNAAEPSVKSMMAKFQSAEATNPTAACVQFFNDVAIGQRAIANTIPKASDLLGQYMAAHPLTEKQIRSDDRRIGCIKAGLNKSFTYDSMMQFCPCFMGGLEAKLSEAEFDDYAAASGKSSDIRSLPQFPRIATVLAACPKPVPGAPG
jgi:hypothetical protein